MAANAASPDGAPTRLAVAPNCPTCATSGRQWAVKNGHPLWKCASCGAIFCDAPIRKPLYDTHYAASPFEAPRYVLDALRRVVDGAAPFKQTGRWLDVGYGEGFLLSIAEQAGWAPFGMEVSTPVLEYGRRRGWVVAEDAAADPRFPGGGFDVVTMIETLEHAPAPTRLLAAAAGWLRPGGLLYLTTPNARSANRWLLGSAWTVFDPPDHRTLWTRTAISRALRNAGFRASVIHTHGLNPVEIAARVRGDRGAAAVDGGSRNRTARALGEMLAASPRRRALKGAANTALSWLGLGDTIKAWAIRERTTHSR